MIYKKFITFYKIYHSIAMISSDIYDSIIDPGQGQIWQGWKTSKICPRGWKSGNSWYRWSGGPL